MNKLRSNCSIGATLDLVGDKWSLLIVRDMLIFQKSTFKDFEESDEGIATNILSNRLKSLVDCGIMSKHKLKANKKANVYLLTPKGDDLIHILAAFVIWGDKYLSHFSLDNADLAIEACNAPVENTIDQNIEIFIDHYKKFREGRLSECTE